MGKKRHSEDSGESESLAKKPNLTEFNGTVFKSMLKEPTKATKGLETFICFAKKLPCPGLYDVVEGYIKISMECAEIFKLLEVEKPIESELMLIFESFEMILLRTASDLSHFSAVGTTIVKKLSGSMKIIQGSLHSENHKFVRQCLSLLSAMVSQGQDAAREVFGHIHFSKGMSGLARRKDKMGKPDIRMAYVQFAVSFLVSGDIATVGQLLEVKELLPEILRTGINTDRISIVNLILSSLKSRVVKNKAISKTQKVRFFTPAVLADLASLYKWNGIVDATTDDHAKAENPEKAAILVVRELVHNFLLELCCSRKNGISFYDSTFGTAGRPGNIVLLQFLVGLKPTEDELVSELLVKTLKVSPDILSRFFKETQYSFTPRLQSAWQDNINLVKKIYEAQPEISTVFRTGEFIPLPRMLAMILVTSLPPVCNKAFFTQGLNIANPVVQYATFFMMSFILKRTHKNMEYLLDKSIWKSSDMYTVNMMEQVVQQYRETLSKILPDMTSIVSKWQSLTKKDKAEGKEKTDKKQRSPEEGATAEAPAADSAELILLKALILQIICLYQKAVPHLVSQCKFDFSKLFKGIVSEKGMRHEVPSLLQYQILQLALELPASKFSWFRLQDAADRESASGEKSVLFSLLKMFVSSSNPQLKTFTQKLVLKVLKDSGVFEYTSGELELWLLHLAKLEPEHQETVIHFLEKVLVRLVCSPYVYTDKVANLVQEAAYLQATLSGHDGDAASIPISHIDDVQDMVDVIMEGGEGEMEEFGASLSDDLIVQTFPFSATVPAALEARNKLQPEKGVVFEYLAAVLTDVLHCQRDPLPLCLALLQNDKLLLSSEPSCPPHPSIALLHHYYSKWLPSQTREELFGDPADSSSLPVPTSFAALMKAAYFQGPEGFLEGIFQEKVEASVAAMTMQDFPVAVKQMLLYIKSTVDNFGSIPKGVLLLKALMGILLDLVTKLQGLQEATNCDPEAEKSEEGAGFFLTNDASSASDNNKEQVLVAVLSSIFKHPCLDQWFLALELASLPPHTLNPVKLKRLSGQLTDDTLHLLKNSAPVLSDLGHLELLAGYVGAVEKAVLRELQNGGSQVPKRRSRPVRGLLSLHRYMDPFQLRDVVSTLLLLPQQSLVTPGEDDCPAELGVYGLAALEVLTSRDQELLLSQAHLRGLGNLLLSCSDPRLEAFLLRVLSRELGSAKLVHPEVLLHCMQRPLQDSRDICCLLLRNCSTHRLHFELWCLEPANLLRLTEQMENFLPLVNAYLQMAGRVDPARPKDVQTEVLRVLKEALLPTLSCSVLDKTAEKSSALHVEALSGLIQLDAKITDISHLISSLPSALQAVGGFERWQLVDVISQKLSDCPTKQETWRKSVVTASIKCLISWFSQSKHQDKAPSTQEESVLQKLQKHLTFAEDLTSSDWNSFVKNGLKYRYAGRHFLNTLTDLLDLLYGDASSPKDFIPIASIHMMASSHSLFLPTMLGSEAEDSAQTKEALVSLLLCLVKKSPSVCDSSHFVVLLGAYGASLSTSDQKLLLILQEYERNNVSLMKFQSLLWGPAAVEHHRARKSLGASLWQQASSEDVLALLHGDRMLDTMARFPQNRRIIPEEGKELIYKDDDLKDPESLYDPCFLLPLFSAMLGPECILNCFKFVSSHAFGFTVMSLSSYDPKVRAAGFHVLSCLHPHLDATRSVQTRQLLYLMDMMKNGIRQKNPRLPFVLTTYIIKVAQQILKPEDHMYVVLSRFLLSQQSLDFRRVPEFFKLFHSFDLEHKVERGWMLGVLEQGVSDRYCYELCSQQGVFPVLLGYSSSPLCDDDTQTQILKVLCRTARVTKAAYNLTNNCGLLSWMLQLVKRRTLEQHLLSGVVHLLHVLWFTNLGEKDKQRDDASTTSASSASSSKQNAAKFLPLPLINEFLYVAFTIIGHLRMEVKAAQLGLFLQTLSSVLKHYGVALGAKTEADILTFKPQPLSCTEALTLLQCWASLSHNATLLGQVQAVAERHKVKELLGTGKGKARARGSSTRSRKQTEEPADHARTAEEERALLTECKPHLSSVFLHWEPERPGDPQHQSGLAEDTAHLLTMWSLRSLVECSYAPKRTMDFLRWMDAAVAPHRCTVELLLRDAGVKADLLRLYHQADRDRDQDQDQDQDRDRPPGWPRVEMLQLFSSIMLQLLEAQRDLPDDLHPAVLAACRSDGKQDPDREGAGLALLSLYIHEMWSGAATPDLFLRHVALVGGAKRGGRRKSGKVRAEQTAVRTICLDIVSRRR